MAKARKTSTSSDFSATVKPAAPKSPPSASPPPHVPRNPAGAVNYAPTEAEQRLIERIQNPKAGMSLEGRTIAENIVRRNVATTEGMTATEIGILEQLAKDCDVALALRPSK